MHGSGTAAARAAGAERVHEQEAEATISKLWPGLADAAAVTDPVAQMQRVAGALLVLLEQLGEQVNLLRSVETGKDLAQLRGVFLAFDKTSGRVLTVLEVMERLGLTADAQELQRQQLTHDQGRLAWVGLLDGFDAIDASREQRELFTAAFLARVRLEASVVVGEVAS